MLKTSDYIEIQNLIHQYPKCLDSGDLVALGELFTHAVVHIQGLSTPIESDPVAITGIFNDFLQLYDGVPRTRHIIANLILQEDGPDQAVATSTVVVFQQTANLPLQPIITGDYHDRFVKDGGTWRFEERCITNDLFGDLSAHGRHEYEPGQ